MNNLLNLINNQNVLEVCTVKQNYHKPALIERKIHANIYKVIEINIFNRNSNYKFNSLFSVYKQNILDSDLDYIKSYIDKFDIIILHSWKGKLWRDLLSYSKSMNKKVIFMNDMINQYKIFTINWLIRKILDLKIRFLNKNNIYFVSLNKLHEEILRRRFGKVNIIYHQWHYCYLKAMISKANKKYFVKENYLNFSNKIKVLFIGRNIPRKGINRFIKVAKIINNSNNNFIFTLAYSGKAINLNPCDKIKLIRIDSINDNSNLYLNNDILYCPFKNEPLGLVPLEGLSYGCILLFDKTIPSMYEFKNLAFQIVSNINEEVNLWQKLIKDIQNGKFNKMKIKSSFLNSVNQIIL